MKDATETPPTLTLVAPVKFVPLIVMVAPLFVFVGVKLVIVGAGINVNPFASVATPPGVVTTILPVVPDPTVAVICVELSTVKEVTAVLPKVTADAPRNPLPLIITWLLAPVAFGEIELMDGVEFRAMK